MIRRSSGDGLEQQFQAAAGRVDFPERAATGACPRSTGDEAQRQKLERPCPRGPGGIGAAGQHDLVLRREQQYRMSLENDSALLRHFMTLPFEVPTLNYKKLANTMADDEGVSQPTPGVTAKAA